MLKKKHEQIQVCIECHDYIQGDWSVFDYYGTTDLRLEELEIMHKEFSEGKELLFNFIAEEEFSKKECEICLSRLAGKRLYYQVWEQQEFVPSNQTMNFNLE